jgi:hypothetical protein
VERFRAASLITGRFNAPSRLSHSLLLRGLAPAAQVRIVSSEGLVIHQLIADADGCLGLPVWGDDRKQKPWKVWMKVRVFWFRNIGITMVGSSA